MGTFQNTAEKTPALSGVLASALTFLDINSEEFSADEQALIHEATMPEVVPLGNVAEIKTSILSGQDPLGEALSASRTAKAKRGIGAIFTPRAIVQSMTEWSVSLDKEFGRIVDAGAGSSRFLAAAGLQFPQTNLVAVELDPAARIVSRANLEVLGLRSRTTIIAGDYRSLALENQPLPTLFIGNPPYVRHHQIAAEWKTWLGETASEFGLKASKLAGLHAHFFLATAKYAKLGDVGAFITSSEWLDVNYGQLVRDLLIDELGVTSIHVIAPEAKPFDDALTTGVISCFEPETSSDLVRLRNVKAVSSLGDLTSGQEVGRARLKDAKRWSPLLRTARKVPDGYIELGELFRVHRGAVTGANRVWVVDPDTTDLPDHVLFRSVTRARELFAAGKFLSHDTGLRAVVDIPVDLDDLGGDDKRSVERFIRAARRAGAHEGYVARHRKAWWSVGLRRPAPILATYMARRPPAFVRNTANARHINIAHGLYPRGPLPTSAIRRVAEVLNTTTHLSSGRTYAGGLVKFEPREMERLLIPDVTTGSKVPPPL